MIHYEVCGSGQALVLIHGYCEDLSIWAGLKKELSKNHLVITLDLPGFGKSELIDPTPSIEFYAKNVLEVLEELNIARCVMLGHSLGGYITLSFAELFPNRLDGFGLIHSTAYADNPEKKENRTKTIDFLQKNGMRAFSPTFVPALFADHKNPLLKDIVERLTKIVNGTRVEGASLAAQAMRDRPDRTHVLHKSSVPVLYVIGKSDKAIPLEDGIAQSSIAAISSAVFLKDVGHMSMYEAPTILENTIQSFINLCLKI